MPHKRKFTESLQQGLKTRQESGLLRTLQNNSGLDFTSNDYLGYSQSSDLKEAVRQAVTEFGVGCGASRLLRGNHPFIEEAERCLAQFSHRERALLFSSGFSANIGLLKALTTSADLILSDELNHASIIDGIKLAPASKKIFRHQDFRHLKALLESETYERAFIITESVFSMDGDLTDLTTLCEIAQEFEAQVIVDEAHATGIFGKNGSGRVEELGLENQVLCTMHTGGKALGVGGAWIASDAAVINHLVNHSRSFVFSTAPIPALVAGLQAAAKKRMSDGESAPRLLELATNFRNQLRNAKLNILESESHIIPVVIGTNAAVLAVASALQEDGFDIRAVRPPTVPEGTGRLRITLNSTLHSSDLERLAQKIELHVRKLEK